MPRPKNLILPQVTLQPTVKPSVVPKYPHKDYQTYRPMRTNNYLSSDDDDYYQPDIFASYTKEYRVQNLDKIKHLKI